MRIVSYNLNGIRAAARLGVIAWLKEVDADVICLQEVRASKDICEEILKPLDNYYKVYNCGDRKGYSGTVTLLKMKPSDISFGLDLEEDREGRIIVTSFDDYIVVNSYIPNGSKRLEYKEVFFKKLTLLMDKLGEDDKKILLCCDANIAHREIDVNKPKQQARKSGFLAEERKWLDNLFTKGFTDSFRFLNREVVQYTWRSYRARERDNTFGWRFRFDYIICNDNVQKLLKRCYSLDLTYSDHLPVILEIDTVNIEGKLEFYL